MAITLQTIAERAGVSRAAVSLILNGRHSAVRISEATRRRVMQAARATGYRRNEIARAMITGKTRVFGFVPLRTTDEFIFRIIVGAMAAADPAGYFIKLLPSQEECHDMRRIADQCGQHRLAGVICRARHGATLAALHRALAPQRIPLVAADTLTDAPADGRVSSNEQQGMELVVRHLLELGHRRLCHLTIPPRGHAFAALRQQCFEAAVAKAGLPPAPIVRLPDDTPTPRHGLAAVDAVLRPQPRPTAVVCASDMLAMLLLQGCGRRGVRVPADLSVTGYAGLRMAAYATPSLTTVHQPFEDIGRTAVAILLDIISQRDNGAPATAPRAVILDVVLEIGKSTAVPPRRGAGPEIK